MKEKDYILVSNLVNITISIKALWEILPWDEICKDTREMRNRLMEIRNALEKEINVK